MTYLNHLKNASKIYLISGPSGVGKDTLINKLKSKSPSYFYPITATSRPKRHNETDGKHYIFLSEKKFQQLINTNEMLEWAKVYGHYYGVPLSQINEAISLDKVINTIGAGDMFYAAFLASDDPNFANLKAGEYISNPL